jgi:hypothetical protein
MASLEAVRVHGDLEIRLYGLKTYCPSTSRRHGVLTLGYDADTVKRWEAPTGSNSPRDHGNLLAYAIAEDLSGDARVRPLFFIVHSMGGLVCEQPLLLCQLPTTTDVC